MVDHRCISLTDINTGHMVQALATNIIKITRARLPEIAATKLTVLGTEQHNSIMHVRETPAQVRRLIQDATGKPYEFT